MKIKLIIRALVASTYLLTAFTGMSATASATEIRGNYCAKIDFATGRCRDQWLPITHCKKACGSNYILDKLSCTCIRAAESIKKKLKNSRSDSGWTGIGRR